GAPISRRPTGRSCSSSRASGSSSLRTRARPSSARQRPTGRSRPTTSRGSTRPVSSCSFAASCGKASCALPRCGRPARRHEAERTLRRRRLAREVGQLPELPGDLDVFLAVRSAKADAPAAPFEALDRDEPELVDPGERLLLTEGSLRGLHDERVAAPAAVVLQRDPAGQHLVEEAPDVDRLDAAEEEPVREHDEVPGESVSADVGGLPDPGLVGLGTDLVVERPPEPGTAAVSLAVRADDEEGVVD